MNKITLAFLFYLIISLFTPSAYSNANNNYLKGFYVGVNGSMDWHSKDTFDDGSLADTRKYDTDFGRGVQVGYILDCWRFELEGLYKKNDLDKVSVKYNPTDPESDGTFQATGRTRTFATMANVIFTVPLICDLGYYAGAGVGASFNKIENYALGPIAIVPPNTRSETLFAWQLLTGISYDLFYGLEASIGYRLFKTSKSKEETGKFESSTTPTIHSFEVGLKYKF